MSNSKSNRITSLAYLLSQHLQGVESSLLLRTFKNALADVKHYFKNLVQWMMVLKVVQGRELPLAALRRTTRQTTARQLVNQGESMPTVICS
jgi:hypothetical protein